MNAAQITEAFTSAPRLGTWGGADIYVPPGVHYFDKPLDLSDRMNVRIQGPGELRYTGAGSDPFISLASSQRIVFRDITLTYDNPEFTGSLISCGFGEKASDPAYLRFENMDMRGFGGARNAASCLELQNTLMTTVVGCRFAHAQIGIDGATRGYANVVTVAEGTTFMQLGDVGIRNAGQSWLIQNCCFEPLVTGQSGAYTQSGEGYAWGLTFDTCWFGDVGVPGRNWLDNVKALGFNVRGCLFDSPGLSNTDMSIRMRGCQGVSITGNRFQGKRGLSFTSGYSRGICVTGNDFQTSKEAIVDELLIQYGFDANEGLADRRG